MGKDNLKWEMYAVADSFRWIIKDKLTSLDNNARAMISEMKTARVKNEYIEEFLPDFFAGIVQEVLAEQSERYDKKERSA